MRMTAAALLHRGAQQSASIAHNRVLVLPILLLCTEIDQPRPKLLPHPSQLSSSAEVLQESLYAPPICEPDRRLRRLRSPCHTANITKGTSLHRPDGSVNLDTHRRLQLKPLLQAALAARLHQRLALIVGKDVGDLGCACGTCRAKAHATRWAEAHSSSRDVGPSTCRDEIRGRFKTTVNSGMI